MILLVMSASLLGLPRLRSFAFHRMTMPSVSTQRMNKKIVERFNEFVKRRGLRRTSQRDSLVATIFAKDEHFTSEELYEKIRHSDANVSRATVYRTISLLVEAGMLREIELGGEEKTYDPNFLEKPAHNHLVCIDCGKVVEFQDDHINVLGECISRRLGFRTVQQSIHIEATCQVLRVKGMCQELLARRLSGKRIKKR
jgi:Fur family ferric uptake transcriptional regulator